MAVVYLRITPRMPARFINRATRSPWARSPVRLHELVSSPGIDPLPCDAKREYRSLSSALWDELAYIVLFMSM